MPRTQAPVSHSSPRDLFRAYQYGRVITLVATFFVLLAVQLFAGVNQQIAYVYLLLAFDLAMTFVYFAAANRAWADRTTLSITGVGVDTVCMVVGVYLVGSEAERYGLIIFGFLVVMAAAVHSSRAALIVGAGGSAGYALLLWALNSELIAWRPEPIAYDLEERWPLMPGLANGAGVMALALISGWLSNSWRQAQSETERLNRELEERVEERTSELTLRNRSLEQAEENITLYARAVSHDLRSPVTVALENAKLALRETGTRRDAFLEETIDALRRGNAMLEGLVDVMREGARIESAAPIDSRAVVRQLIAKEFADHESIRVSGEFPMLSMKREALEHVLRNLVRNAISHNANDPELAVSVTSRVEGSGYLFCVRDSGVGIEPERVERVFDPFIRGTDASSNGLGLGLYSVRRMVARAGGRTWAESIPGKGASVYFTLPAARGVPVESPPSTGLQHRGKSLQVLLVEDDPGHANLMRSALVQVGTVQWAASLSAARQIAESSDFDFFVVDYHLPDGTGVEFLAWALERPAFAAARAVLVSTDPEASGMVSELGVAAFVEKSEGYLARLLAAVQPI